MNRLLFILTLFLIYGWVVGVIYLPDTITYLDPPDKDICRTIGFPFLLGVLGERVIILNCIFASLMIYAIYRMIGWRVLILIILGYPVVYVPNLLPDVIFASLVTMAVWQLRRRRLWLHFVLLGVASLFKPNLAWFFVVEPLVLYLYGYRGRVLIYSAVVVFLVTSFSPVRNLINTGQWTHSDIMLYNIEHYYKASGMGVLYFVEAFKGNWLAPHWGGWLFVIVNLIIWMGFIRRCILRRINWGNVVILAYFIMPTLFANTGARMRLPIEWILLL